MKLHSPKDIAEWLKLRHKFVSSTESSALFGHNPHVTAFEIAVLKKAPPPEPIKLNDRAEWGKRLQDAIAKGIAEDYGVKVEPFPEFAEHEPARMGASFDWKIVGVNRDAPAPEDTILCDMFNENGPGILEIKNVDAYIFKQQWKGEGVLSDIEAPPHIEIQVQHQMHCAGLKWAAIGVLIGGNRGFIIVREYDPAVGDAIESRVNKFWKTLDAGEMPPIKLPDDADIIRKLYVNADPEKVYDGNMDGDFIKLVDDYRAASELRNHWEEARKSISARMLLTIGNAYKAVVPGFTISAHTVAAGRVEAYDRAAYRTLTVRAKGAAKK